MREDKHNNNLMSENNSLIFRMLQINVACFFKSNTRLKEQQCQVSKRAKRKMNIANEKLIATVSPPPPFLFEILKIHLPCSA